MRSTVERNRGIRIQTRIILSALMLIFQLVFLFLLVYNFSSDSVLIYTVSEVLAILMVIYLLNRRGNPSYNTSWIIFILLLPVFGISVYLLFGGGRVMPHLKKKMSKCEAHYLPLLSDDFEAHESLHYDDFSHSRQADYLTNESGYPLYRNTSVEYLSPGEKFLPRFLSELRSAEKYIYMEFFIIAEGKMWEQIFSILCEKAARGVEVRVLFDDFGSIKHQHKDFIRRLQSHGINVAVFNKIKFSVNVFTNNRNHRKIVVIDGKTAVTGGLNIADEYINEFERFGYWMDCAAILKGRAVDSFLAMFCSMWEFTTGQRIDMQAHRCDCGVAASGYVLPYCDGPLKSRHPAEGIYMQMINTAQRYVYITTPYLIIDSTMTTVLTNAARSGVDVRIITPHIPDKWYVHPVTQYNYYELLEAGVKIYEYTPGFIHSKLFVSDDSVATVGTVNMDYRSFFLHFECGVWMSGNESVTDICNHFRQILSESTEITLEAWQNAPLKTKLKRGILHIFAPFM